MDEIIPLLHDLPALGFGFMVVMARVGTTLLTGPGLGENEIPATVRIALAAVLAALVYPSLRTGLPAAPATVDGLLALIGLEIVVGACIGFMARVLVMAMAMAGSIVSLMVGLSSVLQIDPSLGVQVPALQRMLALAALVLLFGSGLYVLPIQAIIGSYEVIPPGGGFDAGGGAERVTGAISDSFRLALQLAAPFMITAMVWNAALGFVSRVIPNIHVHVVAAPAQILSGLLLLGLAIAAMFGQWTAGVRMAFSSLPGL